MKQSFDNVPINNEYEALPIGFEATWTPATPDAPYTGSLSVVVSGVAHEDGRNQISGLLSSDFNDQGLHLAMIGGSGIDEEYQGQGMGAELYRAFTRVAKQHGATHIGGVLPSAAAMRTRARVFGVERMKFYEETQFHEDMHHFSQEISLDECRKRVEARERRDQYADAMTERYNDDGSAGVDVTERMTADELRQLEAYEKDENLKPFLVLTDVSDLDTSGWAPYTSTRIAPPTRR